MSIKCFFLLNDCETIIIIIIIMIIIIIIYTSYLYFMLTYSTLYSKNVFGRVWPVPSFKNSARFKFQESWLRLYFRLLSILELLGLIKFISLTVCQVNSDQDLNIEYRWFDTFTWINRISPPSIYFRALRAGENNYNLFFYVHKLFFFAKIL